MLKRALVLCFFWVCASTSAFAIPLVVDNVTSMQPLLPELLWQADPDGQQTIESISTPEAQAGFASLRNGFPLRATGPVWLKLSLLKAQRSALTPAPQGGTPLVSINLGRFNGGNAQVFLRETGEGVVAHTRWTRTDVGPSENLVIPAFGATPQTIFMRLPEVPGLWFQPTVQPQENVTAPLLPPDQLLPGLVVLACLVCLLRALKERSAWRFWAAVFLGFVLADIMLPLPLLHETLSYAQLPAMLAPGLSLLLLPHLGRAMLGTNKSAPVQDILLSGFSLVGIAAALMPLVPGYQWLTRLFPLWPLLLFPLLPVCFWALQDKRRGALAFTGICIMPFIGAVLSFWAMEATLPSPMAVQGSMWGLAIGGLSLALVRGPHTARSAAQHTLGSSFPLLQEVEEGASGAPSLLPQNNPFPLLPTANNQNAPAQPGQSPADNTSQEDQEDADHMPGASLEAAFSATLAEQQAALARANTPQEQTTPGHNTGNAPAPSAEASASAGATQETILFPLPEDVPAAPEETGTFAPKVASTPTAAMASAAPSATTQASALPASTPLGDTSAVQPRPVAATPKQPAQANRHEDNTLTLAQAASHASLGSLLGDEPLSMGAATHEASPEASPALGLLGSSLSMPASTNTRTAKKSPAQPAAGQQGLHLAPSNQPLRKTPPAVVATSTPLSQNADHARKEALPTHALPPLEMAAPHKPATNTPDAEKSGQKKPPLELPALDLPPAGASRSAAGSTTTERLMQAKGLTPKEYTPSGLQEDTLSPGFGSVGALLTPKAPPPAQAHKPAATGAAKAQGAAPVPAPANAPVAQQPSKEAAPQHTPALSIFNLTNIIRRVDHSLEPRIKQKGVIFSWVLDPRLPTLLKGDAFGLYSTLSGLLSDSIDATDAGFVQLAVRHIHTESNGPLILSFSITDTGTEKRQLAHQGQGQHFATANGGSFTVEYSPTHGPLITMTAQFELPTALVETPGNNAVSMKADTKETPVPAAAQAREKTAAQGPAPSVGKVPLSKRLANAAQARQAASETTPSATAQAEANTPAPENTKAEPQAEAKAAPEATPHKAPPVAQPEAITKATVEPETEPKPKKGAAPKPEQKAMPQKAVTPRTTAQQKPTSETETVDDAQPAPQASAQVVVQPASPVALAQEPLQHPATARVVQLASVKAGQEAQAAASNGAQHSAPPDGTATGNVEATATVQVQILVSDMTTSNLRLISHYLNQHSLPHTECKGVQALVNACTNEPANLIIVDADMPEDDLQKMLHKVHSVEADNNWPPAAVLALISHQGQEERMRAIGCNHILQKPFGKDEFVNMVHKAVPTLHNGTVNKNTSTAPQSTATPGPDMPTHSTEPYIQRLLAGGMAEAHPNSTHEPAKETAKGLSTRAAIAGVLERTGAISPGSGHAETAAAAAAMTASKIAQQREKKLEALHKGRTKSNSPAVRKITVVQKTNSPEHSTPRPGAVRVQRNTTPVQPKSAAIPLPGIEGATMNAQMLPLVPGLILSLRDALSMCEKAAQDNAMPAMQEAMETIRQKAAVFQLEKLEKMASCVQRAAAANDSEAVTTLMDDMRSFALRHITAVEECFKNYLAETAEGANG
ncbi:response regulator [Desulfovibrio cuneatus]|uniref:response regulator n=1 Tax=Desulfovibrio cuneatus TaxID=159728 RepID=UPI00041A1EDD|nr:response regulator [Desulfovibrio cuneatus]